MAISFRFMAGLLLFLASFSLFAQDSSDSQSTEYGSEGYLEEVIVTGTRIARRDFNTPSPLTSIGEEVIDFTNQPTLEDTLNRMVKTDGS